MLILEQDRCLSIFRREDSRSVQAAALAPLLSILELSMEEGEDLDFSLDWTCAESLLVQYRKAKTSGTCILLTLFQHSAVQE
jgi:hypothetical protein